MAGSSEGFTKTAVCPLCSRAVRYDPEQQSADAAVDLHSRGLGCDPSNYQRVNAKRRCPVPNCKEKLVAVNVFACQGCCTDVCLRHRFPTDHDCSLRAAAKGISQPKRSASNGPFRAPTSGESGPSQFAKLFGRMGLGGGSSARGTPASNSVLHSAARQQQGATAAAAGATGAALDPRRQQAPQAAPGRQQQQASGNGSSSGSSSLFSGVAAALRGLRRAAGPQDPAPAQPQIQQSPVTHAPSRQPQDTEVCADCGARFNAVGDLVAHYEAVHG